MTATTSDVEILGEYTHPHGEFEPSHTDKLIRRDGKLYVINWIFGGIADLRGGAVRPYLLDVRQDQLAEILPYFTPGSGVYREDYDNAIAGLDGCREIESTSWAWGFIR